MRTALCSGRARFVTTFAAGVYLTFAGSVHAQTAEQAALLEMLQDGGLVLVMRHMSASAPAPAEGPVPPREAGNRNLDREPELDPTGRAHASAVGYAFRGLGVKIGDVYSSPTLRARETATYLAYDPELIDALAPSAGGDGVLELVAEAPDDGTNTLVITHAQNIGAAFGDDAADVEAGETLIVRTENGAPRVFGRLTVRDWAVLVVEGPRS